MASAKKTGLHDRINRISHWDVNVTNLERSRAWYEATTKLRVIARTTASQSFSGLGVTNGNFEGLMMKDTSMPKGSPMIHLVEWKKPCPVGTPYLSHTNVGWYRIVPSVENIEETRQKVIQLGSEPFTATTKTHIRLGPSLPEIDYRVFTVHDPDGIAVEFVDDVTHSTGCGGSTSPQTPTTVAHNTARFEESLPFYRDVLGLDMLSPVQTPGQIPNVYSPGGGTTGFTGAFWGVRGALAVFLDWLQWTQSSQHPTPYKDCNHVGIIRCVFEVDDVDAAYDAAKEQSQKHGFAISEPEVWDFGPEFGERKLVNMQDPEGVAFQLIQQPRLHDAALHPYGEGAELGGQN